MTHQSDLFPDAVQPSPRLLWLRRHNVVTKQGPNGRWRAVVLDEVYGCGATEDEAILDLCERHGYRHWSVEP